MSDPIDVINEVLHLGGDFTVRGDELKVWLTDDEGPGIMKAYLGVEECGRLAEAFEELRRRLSFPRVIVADTNLDPVLVTETAIAEEKP